IRKATLELNANSTATGNINRFTEQHSGSFDLSFRRTNGRRDPARPRGPFEHQQSHSGAKYAEKPRLGGRVRRRSPFLHHYSIRVLKSRYSTATVLLRVRRTAVVVVGEHGIFGAQKIRLVRLRRLFRPEASAHGRVARLPRRGERRQFTTTEVETCFGEKGRVGDAVLRRMTDPFRRVAEAQLVSFRVRRRYFGWMMVSARAPFSLCFIGPTDLSNGDRHRTVAWTRV
ncbi:conserved hypothetical protein, partial [Trichinella spiralis]|uniref:hypothetical protein n=1 Tax=Trichinella spiralis TaxID=6334 RepID=UPI0001EFD4BB